MRAAVKLSLSLNLQLKTETNSNQKLLDNIDSIVGEKTVINGVEPILPPTKAELYQLLVNGENLGSRSLAEVKGDLLRPLPEDYISWKPTFSKGKKQDDVPYISWTDCLFILDYICPNYTYTLEENQIGNQCIVKGCLTLHCFDCDYTVEALGAEDLEKTSFGGAVMDACAIRLA